MKYCFLLLSFLVFQCIGSKKIANPDMVHPGLYPIKQAQRWGYANNQGEIIVPIQFDTAAFFHSGLAVAGIEGKLGYIDRYGAWKIAPKYDKASRFYHSCAEVSRGNSNKWINRAGKKVIDCSTLIDNEMVPPKTPLSPENHTIYNGNKYALLFQTYQANPSSEKFESKIDTTAFIFDEVITFSSKALLVKKSGKIGVYPVSNFSPKPSLPLNAPIEEIHLISQKGDTTYSIPMLFDDCIVRNVLDDEQPVTPNALVHVKINEHWALLDHKGKMLLPATFYSINTMHYPLTWVEYLPEEFGYINLANGKSYFPGE